MLMFRSAQKAVAVSAKLLVTEPVPGTGKETLYEPVAGQFMLKATDGFKTML